MKQWAVAVALAVGLSAGGSAAFAADPGLAAEVELLKSRLASLEQKLAQQGARSVGAAADNAIIQLPNGIHGIELSGFVDTSYTYNFNEPRDRVNDVRVFDTQANSFILNNAQLNIAKGVDVASPLGFKLALMFGDEVGAAGRGRTSTLQGRHERGELRFGDAYSRIQVIVYGLTQQGNETLLATI